MYGRVPIILSLQHNPKISKSPVYFLVFVHSTQGIPYLHDESIRTKNRLWKIIKMTNVLIKILQVKQCVLIGADSSTNDTSSSNTYRRKFSSNGNFVEMSLRQIHHWNTLLDRNLTLFSHLSPCKHVKRERRKNNIVAFRDFNYIYAKM